jgi:hypothetical protein
MDDAFGHWLAGFADGEGSFMLRTGKAGIVCAFQIGLRSDDKPVLKLIRDTVGFGRVGLASRMGEPGRAALYSVQSRKDCAALVRIFDRYPLRAKKATDFAIWREAVSVWISLGPHCERLVSLREALRASRDYVQEPLEIAPARQLRLAE